MNEDIITAYEDDDPILPEGWNEGDDLFTGEDNWLEEAAPQAEEPQADQTPAEDPENAPTPERTEADGDGAEDPQQAPNPEPEGAPAPRKLKFTARVDREDREVEVEESEVSTLYQKAQVVDRVQAKLAKLSPAMEKAERLSKRLGYDGLDAMLEAAEHNWRSGEVQRLVAEGVHEEVAKDVVEHRMEHNGTGRRNAGGRPCPKPGFPGRGAGIDDRPAGAPEPAHPGGSGAGLRAWQAAADGLHRV